MIAYLQQQRRHRRSILLFGVVMLGVQAWVFFGPPPASPAAVAWMALAGYVTFALVIWWLADRPQGGRTP